MAICIAGMHRSGTSMVSRLLNLSGLYIGPENELVSPAPDNQEGFWENLRFVELNEEILSSLGGGWDLPPDVPNGWELQPEMLPLRTRAASLVQRFSANEPWGWKDPRNSLTFAFWKRMVPDLKVVICLRHPLEVARSLYRRGYSSDAFTLNLWLTYNQRLLSQVRPEDRVVTHYDAYFCDTQAELQRILGFLRIPVSREKIDQACSATLARLRHHSLAGKDLLETKLPDDVSQCYMEMCAEAGPICRMALGSDLCGSDGEIHYSSRTEAENADDPGRSRAESAGQTPTVDNAEIAGREQAIQSLFAQLAQEKSRAQALEREITTRTSDEAALRTRLAEKEAQLKRITGSFGWRLLSLYGPIKYRYVLPLLRLLRLLPSAEGVNQRTQNSPKNEV